MGWVKKILIIGLVYSNVVFGQSYPTKPVRWVSPAPGASGDFTARLISQNLASGLGQPVIVDNRVGYGAIDAVVKAPPDGYTFLVYGSTLWTAPLLESVFWDVERDLMPVALLNSTPSTVVVHPSLPVRSVKALIDLARARPGVLNCGSAPTGSSQNLAAEFFKSLAAVNFLSVPYKSSGAAQIGLIGGEVDLLFPPIGSVIGHVKSGRLRLLAVASDRPVSFLPGVPTVKASGLPGYEFATVVGLFAPAHTPSVMVHRINREVMSVLRRESVAQRFLNEALELELGEPERLAKRMALEVERFSQLIDKAGLRQRKTPP